MLYGGSAFLGYQLVFDFLRHHDHTNLRPMIIDHAIAFGLIGAAAGALTGSGSLRRMWVGFLFSFATLAPMTWWLKMQGLRPGSYRRPANIFYEDDVTPDEVARFQAMD